MKRFTFLKVAALLVFIRCGLSGGAFAAAPTSVPTHVPVGQTIAWDASKDGDPKIYLVGDLKLTLKSGATKDGDPIPVLTVESPKFGRAVMAGQSAFSNPTASVLVAPIDPKADGPVVALQTYTGGAHCCTEIDMLDPLAGHWRRVDAGQWDGSFSIKPHTLKGDPTPYVQLYDNAFLYAFACYACAYAPPRVFNLVGGRWLNVSTQPNYAPVFRRDEAEEKKQCDGGDGGGQNGHCANFTADAARLGEFDQAWAYMLAHYDKTDQWRWPAGCKVQRVKDQCPKGQEIVFKTYPEALRNFLRARKYIPAG